MFELLDPLLELVSFSYLLRLLRDFGNYYEGANSDFFCLLASFRVYDSGRFDYLFKGCSNPCFDELIVKWCI